jgi:Ca2+-binding EF-hand superfamily protein
MWHGSTPAALVAVIVLTCVSSALAQTPGPTPAFQETDTNKDGQIDRAEFQGRVLYEFSSRDQDKDGFLTQSELPHVTAEAVRAADGDSDGRLSAIEYMNQRLREFDAADRNRDGVLTQAEMAMYPGIVLFRW